MFSWQNDVLQEVRPGTDILMKATCIPCNEVIFDWPANASHAEGQAQSKRMMLHLDLHHSYKIGVDCRNH